MISAQQLPSELYNSYEGFKEQSIQNRRFKHSDIVPIIENLDTSLFQIELAGKSIEDRDIYLVKYGEGPTSVLLWSQMHGDEPTATMAMMDLFHFLSQTNGFNQVVQEIKSKLTLYFIPMLNPDGAQQFKRRNAIGIDLNRDALRLRCPESLLLRKIRDTLNADWGFNLHDQSRYYAAGDNPKEAAFSFLAPAFNPEKSLNQNRQLAMQLIVQMNEMLQQFIPGKVARYNDTFEPRAFGDNMQKQGTRTILIESGGLKDDHEKQELRKLHFVLFVNTLLGIASEKYNEYDIEDYETIPKNNYGAFHDVLIRNANLPYQSKKFAVDIAIRRQEVDDKNHLQYHMRGTVQDIGDLSTSFGYTEIDASSYELSYGKVYPEVITSMDELKQLQLEDLLKKGFTNIIMPHPPPAQNANQLPILISKNGSWATHTVALGNNPSLLFSKNGEIQFAVVNGLLTNLKVESADLAGKWNNFVGQ